MTSRALPLSAPLGVLNGRASLYLPIPVSVSVPIQLLLTSDRIAWAKPVRLDSPDDWPTNDIKHVDVVFLIDESGSMYGSGGDPRGVRRAAALSVVHLMARAS
jgi:hypothetical protein